jgi:hypothetical protein
MDGRGVNGKTIEHVHRKFLATRERKNGAGVEHASCFPNLAVRPRGVFTCAKKGRRACAVRLVASVDTRARVFTVTT